MKRKSIQKYLAIACIAIFMLAGLYVTFLSRSPVVSQPSVMVQQDPTNDSTDEIESDSDSEDVTHTTDSDSETSNHVKHIFFDLNDILFEVSKKQAFSELGAMDIAAYTFGGNKAEDLENKLFEVLEHLEPSTAEHIQNNEVPIHHEKQFPPIMCRWLRGELSSEELYAQATAFMENPANAHYFKNEREHRLVQNILRIMVDVSTRCKVYLPMKKGIALLSQCKEAGHKIYLLVNMDNEIIGCLKAKYPEVFAHFDGIIISSEIGMLKPGRTFFDHLFKKYNITAADCFLIDGTDRTIACAKTQGIAGFHYESNRHSELVKELRTQGILSE